MAPDPLERWTEIAVSIAELKLMLVQSREARAISDAKLDTVIETARQTGHRVSNADQEIVALKVVVSKNERRIDRLEGAPWRVTKWVIGGVGTIVTAGVVHSYGWLDRWLLGH